MNFIKYFQESDEFMRSLLWCMNNAIAAEKMYSGDSFRDSNIGWTNDSYVSEIIDKERSYKDNSHAIMIGDYFSKLISYQYQTEGLSSVCIGNINKMIPPNQIIPTVSICMQFSLLEDYEFSEFDRFVVREELIDDKLCNRYKKKPVRERLKILSAIKNQVLPERLCHAYESLSNFRNLLTHEPNKLCKSPMVAIDYYVTCQAVSFEINNLIGEKFCNDNVSRRLGFWKCQLDKFKDAVIFS